MVILGIDPGYDRLGWGVIKPENKKQPVLDYGCLTTPKLNPAARLLCLYKDLKKIIDKWQPQAMAVEELFFSRNRTTAIQVAQARGIVLLVGAEKKCPVYAYNPQQIKLAVTGYGQADKKQVQKMTQAILNLKTMPRPDDAADALAAALTHASSHKFLDRVK